MCNPTTCALGCCNAKKECPVSSNKCLYYKASEFPCDDEMDCPEKWTC